MAIIPLDELIPGATIRFTVIESVQYLSIRDYIMHFCRKDGNHAADMWRNLSEIHKKEVRDFLARYQFPGRGQTEQPVITFKGAIYLAMILPGKHAKTYRTAFVDLIQRHLNGDATLCTEINENKKRGMVQSCLSLINKRPAHNSIDMPVTNYVYATKSDAFPGLIKIGKAVNVRKRLSSLNTACAPVPHYVVAMAPTFDYTRDERTAHAFFALTRKEGEFFEITEEAVKSYFDHHITAQYQRELADKMTNIQGSVCHVDDATDASYA
jgi:hypothetical protein